MYRLPSRTPAQKKVNDKLFDETLTYNMREHRKKYARYMFFKKSSTHISVYYRGIFICCLFYSDSTYLKRRMMNAVFEALDAMERSM